MRLPWVGKLESSTTFAFILRADWQVCGLLDCMEGQQIEPDAWLLPGSWTNTILVFCWKVRCCFACKYNKHSTTDVLTPFHACCNAAPVMSWQPRTLSATLLLWALQRGGTRVDESLDEKVVRDKGWNYTHAGNLCKSNRVWNDNENAFERSTKAWLINDSHVYDFYPSMVGKSPGSALLVLMVQDLHQIKRFSSPRQNHSSSKGLLLGWLGAVSAVHHCILLIEEPQMAARVTAAASDVWERPQAGFAPPS